MSQAPLFLFPPVIWPAVDMFKNLITIPSRKGLRQHVPPVQRAAWPLGSWWIHHLLSPREEPAHLVWCCDYRKGLQQQCLALLNSRCLQFILSYNSASQSQLSPHLSSVTTQDLSAYWQQMDTHKKACGGERCAQSLSSWKITNHIRSIKNS